MSIALVISRPVYLPDGCSMISAITNRGKLYFMVLNEKIRGRVFIDLLSSSRPPGGNGEEVVVSSGRRLQIMMNSFKFFGVHVILFPGLQDNETGGKTKISFSLTATPVWIINKVVESIRKWILKRH